MNPYVFITISIVVAAFIGGLTNHLAIKMLFHPRGQWRIAGRKVPFTPGLIPKRKDEIAGSLGQVVAEYLVTSHGITSLLRKPEFRESIEVKLKGAVRRLVLSDQTAEQICLRLWPNGRWSSVKSELAVGLGRMTEIALEWLWYEKGWSKVKLGELLPEWTEERREALVEVAVKYITDALRSELASPNGEKLVRQMIGQLLEQAGGMLGALAGIFMDENKIAGKVRQALWEALDSSVVRASLRRFADGQIRKAEELRLEDIVRMLGEGEEGETVDQIKGWLDGRLDWEVQLEKLLQTRVDEWLGGKLSWIEERLPALTSFILNLLEHHIERILEAVELNKLVETQVKEFPIERLERIILSVSGREFRAITWLGALLGGLIGSVQAVFLLWMI